MADHLRTVAVHHLKLVSVRDLDALLSERPDLLCVFLVSTDVGSECPHSQNGVFTVVNGTMHRNAVAAYTPG